MDIDEYKTAQRRIWADGDYGPIGRALAPTAQILVDRVGVTEGQRVLDVATGSGSVAVAAASAGGDVIGVDITDAWFDAARCTAHAAGVEVALVVGDVERLPVKTATFDVVLSSFGAICAPRHDIVAAELVRVCRQGGTIGLTAWTPEGASYTMMSTLTRSLPPPPAFVTPSIRWGQPSHVQQLFASYDVDVVFERPSFSIEFESVDAFETVMVDNSGGFDDLRRTLDEVGSWQRAHLDFRQTLEQANEADDGSCRITWDCLLIMTHKRDPTRAAN